VDDWLSQPAFQGGIAPFAVALVVAVALQPIRLGGLAVIAALLTSVHFVSGMQMVPLTATRKVVLLSAAAPLVGLLVDLAFRHSRATAWLALGAGAAALWAFWPLLAQRPAQEAFMLAATAALACAFLVGFSQWKLSDDSVRVGAAGLALGLGVGVASIFSASASYGLYGISIAAGAGAFLLPQMVRGKRSFAGATFTVSATLAAGLVGAGAMVLAQLPWYSLLALALVPLAVCLPLPGKAPVWLQAVLSSMYGLFVAAGACVLAWPSAT
jgi:hypothetical protein